MATNIHKKERTRTGQWLRNGRWAPETMVGDECSSLCKDLLNDAVYRALLDADCFTLSVSLRITSKKKPRA